MNYQYTRRIALAIATTCGVPFSNVEASPLSAYYELCISALGSTSEQTLLGLVENYTATSKSLLAIIDNDLNPNPKDPQFVINMVEAVLNDDMMKLRGGLVSRLTNISESAKSLENAIATKNSASSIKDMLGDVAKFNNAAKAIGKSVARGESGVAEMLAAIYHGTASINDLESLGSDAKDFMQQLYDRKLTAEQMHEAIGMVIAQSGVHTAQEMEVIRKKNNILWQKLIIQEAVLEHYKDSINSNNSANTAAKISVIRADFTNGIIFNSYKERITTLGAIYPDYSKIENQAGGHYNYSNQNSWDLLKDSQLKQPSENTSTSATRKTPDEKSKIISDHVRIIELSAKQKGTGNNSSTDSNFTGIATALQQEGLKTDQHSISISSNVATVQTSSATVNSTPVLTGGKLQLNHSASASQFDYMSWGTWSGNLQYTQGGRTTALTSGNFITGSRTAAAQMPKSGTATYSGPISGQYIEAGARSNDLGGSVNLTANFNTMKIGGGFAFKRGDGTNLMTVQLPSSAGNINGNQFYGTSLQSSGTPVAGHVIGNFYGNQGQEIGGAVQVNSGNKVISGVFGAQAQ